MPMRDELKVIEQFYSGTTLTNWLRLLWANRFAIDWCYVPRALFVTFAALVSLPFRAYEQVRFRRRIEATPIEKPPLFILGHWRSGTTYLHVLLAQDRRFAYASNLQVILPEIFLGSSAVFEGAVRRFMPQKRWMDNFLLAPELPSEDEFAIANLTPYSMYHSLVFPRNRYRYLQYCTMDNLAEHERREWQEVVLHYLKKLTLHAQGRPLVLKNPTYTARIRLLLELFPEARFVHICRNPYEVFSSTLRMYERMFPAFFLQKPRQGEAQDYILDAYRSIYMQYFAQRDLIPAGRLVEVRYEDLLREPLRVVRHIYDGLGLEGFADAESAFTTYVAAQREFQVNRNMLSEELCQEVAERWGFAFDAWGYPREEAACEVAPEYQLVGR
jgi:hypothetical protein